MNVFDYDHPMYVHMIQDPEGRAVPTASTLRKTFRASADLTSAAGVEVIEAEYYPENSWSISPETLDTMRGVRADFKLFIEVGTFIGQGVVAIHRYFSEHAIDCPIVTVDSYAGTLLIDVDMNEVPKGFIRYFNRSVLGTLFTRMGLGEASFPVQATARDFFRKFYYLGHQASHIYLDASHEYLDTYEEMRLAWECLAEGGVLAGDDYNWATVKAAVDRFCFERRLSYTTTQGRTNGGVTATQWVIAAKKSGVRHDDHLHNKKAVA